MHITQTKDTGLGNCGGKMPMPDTDEAIRNTFSDVRFKLAKHILSSGKVSNSPTASPTPPTPPPTSSAPTPAPCKDKHPHCTYWPRHKDGCWKHNCADWATACTHHWWIDQCCACGGGNRGTAAAAVRRAL